MKLVLHLFNYNIYDIIFAFAIYAQYKMDSFLCLKLLPPLIMICAKSFHH